VGTLHLLLRLLALLLTLLAALPLHAAWRLGRLPSPWPRRFLATCGWIVGARTRLVGALPPANTLILANHLSWIDILLLAGSANAVFVAKGELAGVPLVGWLCRLNDTIFVARGDRMAIDTQVAQVRAALGARPVAIFPEGTTGDGVTLLPFKSSLLAAADPAPPGLVIQPVRIDYGDATADLAWVGDEPGARHALRVLRRRGSFPATLAFAAPFAPGGGRKAIAAEARARIEALAPSP